ncbi:putative laccase-9 [Vitis vinifera]|uniref:Laccase n=1 Tax=Vitis vinifera TaxID=29760 RepID=A0A438CB63_VITVI|nr:putative laccase-9 [Vitis vinifera]
MKKIIYELKIMHVYRHGVKQPRNPWADGPEYITQCPIQPGSNFTYEIIFSTEEGTLWWHAHSDWSRATIHGAIIVLPRKGTSYPFPEPDEEETIIFSSWFKGDVMKMYNEAVVTGVPKLSDAFTINGQPGDLYPCSNETTYRLLVQYGKTYLLRIVNAILNEELFFSVAEHNLTIVGTDGAYIKPVITNYIMIIPGQTLDVLVTANQPPSNYYMAARAFVSGTFSFHNGTTTGIFQYTNCCSLPLSILQYTSCCSPRLSPSFPNLPSYKDSAAALTFTKSLRSLANQDYPVYVPQNINTQIIMTVSLNLLPTPEASCARVVGNRCSGGLNNISWVMPSTAILQTYYRQMEQNIFTYDFPDQPPWSYNYTGENLPSSLLVASQGTKAKVVNYSETVEIVFQGTNAGGRAENHPMHLHGYNFYLVGIGSGNFNNETDPKNYNLNDPPYVNTIGVPKNGWAAIRFRAENPGVWFMHCHLEKHATWGMDMVLIVKNGSTAATSIRPPPAYMPDC